MNKNDSITLIVLAIVLIVVGVLVYRLSTKNSSQTKGYQTGQHSGGWLSALFDNAANIVDAGGRHTAGTVTATGNAIASIIATSKTGKYAEASYGYADPKTDYGPYIIGGVLVVTAGVVSALLLTKK